MIIDAVNKSFDSPQIVPIQILFKRPKSRVLPLVLHAIALANLTATFAIMLLLSISNVQSEQALGLAVVDFNSVTPINVVDGKTGQIVVQNPSSISVSLDHMGYEYSMC